MAPQPKPIPKAGPSGLAQFAAAAGRFLQSRAQLAARKTATRLDQASERRVKAVGQGGQRIGQGVLDYAHDWIDIFTQFLLGGLGLETDTDKAIAERARRRQGMRAAHRRELVVQKEKDRKTRKKMSGPKFQMPHRDKSDPRPIHRWLFGLPVGDRSGKRWTKRDDYILGILSQQNYTGRQAAVHLGRTEAAVRSRAARLGILFS